MKLIFLSMTLKRSGKPPSCFVTSKRKPSSDTIAPVLGTGGFLPLYRGAELLKKHRIGRVPRGIGVLSPGPLMSFIAEAYCCASRSKVPSESLEFVTVPDTWTYARCRGSAALFAIAMSYHNAQLIS